MSEFRISEKSIQNGIQQLQCQLVAFGQRIEEQKLFDRKISPPIKFDELERDYPGDHFKKETGRNNYSELNSEPVFSRLDGITNAVYIVSAQEFPYDLKTITGQFEELKKDDKVCMCRINKENKKWKSINKNKPVVLYVGSSGDSHIKTRLREHWGKCSDGTYSLHLDKWWLKDHPDEPLQIDIWELSKFGEDDQAYLQIVEDILWDQRKPLFGKRGVK
jgi:hypothetical protein